jgi:putative transposase
MPNYRRANIAGGTYFFTVNALRRLPVLTETSVRDALRDTIRQTRLTAPFDIDAWVLLPNHLHCVWTLPQGDADFSMRWSKIKRYVSQQCGDAFGIKEMSPIACPTSRIWFVATPVLGASNPRRCRFCAAC